MERELKLTQMEVSELVVLYFSSHERIHSKHIISFSTCRLGLG